ncbi:glycosyltransferase family 4 protein [Vreelandella janggokensis]|uniref:Glycosyltransferase family 4 protein n=1 Tax=Vreelandella janggokensis TaxID=370767 RepID=A0ABT4IRH5_9GAMM|nr:glycosyltransferase family 4 protein [Halomonas janggokensis]MCZ0925756.1 glycosyltransferase family 4 protein [Halomonas janggokensis]
MVKHNYKYHTKGLLRGTIGRVHWGLRRYARDRLRYAKKKVRYIIGKTHWGLRRLVRDATRFVMTHWLRPSMRTYLIAARERRMQAQYAQFLDIYRENGLEAVFSKVKEVVSRPHDRNKILVAVARNAMNYDVRDVELTVKALLDDTNRIDILKWSIFAAWDSGNIQFTSRLLGENDWLEHESKQAAYKVRQIRGCARLFKQIPKIPPALTKRAYMCGSRDILYIASSSRPYHITGYTSRTHHVLQALKASGWNVYCVTRPGYPFDRPDARDVSDEVIHQIDGIFYERLPGVHRREVDYDDYLRRSADEIEQAALRLKPSLIQAASNYEAAFPALIAARRLGIPFVYEVRGLWEYTAASKKPGWEHTQRFELDRNLEALVASHANHVFTLTTALADELSLRGVNPEIISLAPNGIEPEAFQPKKHDLHKRIELGLPEDAFVVGYIGSVVAYEGLDDLISAARVLVSEYSNLRVVIVGDGDARFRLEKQVKDYELGSRVIFTGKVPPAEVSRYFSIFDAVSLPRKPYQVCRLVSPLKPLEAMAMNIPMIVSDVEALSEMVEDGVSALIHKSGDYSSLADAIRRLITNPDLASGLVKNARTQMLPARKWSTIAHEMSNALDREVASVTEINTALY